MATSKLRGFSIVDMVNWNLTNNANNITDTTSDHSVTQFISAIETLFGYLVRTFNYFLPTEISDHNRIGYWLRLVAPYLIPVVVLIMCICCFSCFCSCICSVIRFLFRCAFSIIKRLFKFIFFGVRIILRRLWRCMISRRRRRPTPAVKIFTALGNGNPSLIIERGVFEDNPKGYFSSPHGNPSDFVC